MQKEPPTSLRPVSGGNGRCRLIAADIDCEPLCVWPWLIELVLAWLICTKVTFGRDLEHGFTLAKPLVRQILQPRLYGLLPWSYSRSQKSLLNSFTFNSSSDACSLLFHVMYRHPL